MNILGRGFTLIELTVVLAVMGLLAVMGARELERRMDAKELADRISDAKRIFQQQFANHADPDFRTWIGVPSDGDEVCGVSDEDGNVLHNENLWESVCYRNDGGDLVVSFSPNGDLLNNQGFTRSFSSEMGAQDFNAGDLSVVVNVPPPARSSVADELRDITADLDGDNVVNRMTFRIGDGDDTITITGEELQEMLRVKDLVGTCAGGVGMVDGEMGCLTANVGEDNNEGGDDSISLPSGCSWSSVPKGNGCCGTSFTLSPFKGLYPTGTIAKVSFEKNYRSFTCDNGTWR